MTAKPSPQESALSVIYHGLELLGAAGLGSDSHKVLVIAATDSTLHFRSANCAFDTVPEFLRMVADMLESGDIPISERTITTSPTS